MLVHNHPSATLKPREADKDITDRLIQVGLILNVPVLDHLIITTNSFLSFNDVGLIEELSRSTRYVPPFKQVEQLRRQAEEIGKEKGRNSYRAEVIKAMKREGLAEDVIARITGVPLADFKAFKE